MAFLEWSPEYILHVDEMDEHHIQLFELVNRMHEAIINGAEPGAVNGMLDQFIDLAVEHFAAEEDEFREYDYPKALDHKYQHDDLKMQLLEKQASLQDNGPKISIELPEYLAAWLKEHTMSSDQEFTAFVLGND